MAATTKTWSNGSAPDLDDVDLNGFKEENNNLIVGSGQALSTGDRQQSHDAVVLYAAGKANFYTGGGAANAYTGTPVASQRAPTNYFQGLIVTFNVTARNSTGSSTFNLNGLGAKTIVNKDGGTPNPGYFEPGIYATLFYDGTKFICIDRSESQMRNQELSSDHSEITTTFSPIGFSVPILDGRTYEIEMFLTIACENVGFTIRENTSAINKRISSFQVYDLTGLIASGTIIGNQIAELAAGSAPADDVVVYIRLVVTNTTSDDNFSPDLAVETANAVDSAVVKSASIMKVTRLDETV